MARAPLARPTDAPPRAHSAEPAAAIVARPAPDAEPLAEEAARPHHVAIIMDGNRRWARNRGLTELEGHGAGVEAVRALLRHAVRRRGPRAP